jgi:hemoglobin
MMNEDLRPQQLRRAAFTSRIQAETAIDGVMIERLVRVFYARVREDDVLGPIFAKRIKDWEPHLQKMCDFWSSVVLMSGRYHGKPMAMHIALPVDARHFDRWLALFEATARELCPSSAANHFIRLAHRIAETLELGIADERGMPLKRSGRSSAG